MTEPLTPAQATPRAGWLDVLPVAAACLDADGRVVWANARWRQLLAEVAPADHCALNDWLAALHPDDRAMLRSACRVPAPRRDPFETDVRFERRPADRWRCRLANLPEGGVLATLQDVSAEGERLRSLLQSVPAIIWEVDADERVAMVQGKLALDHPLAGADAVGRPLAGVLSGKPRLLARHRRALAGQPVTGTHRHGGSIFAESYRAIIEGEGVRGVIGVALDVTEHVEAQEAARTTQSLARLGEMATHVAHEINPLAGIAGVLQVFRRRFSAGEERRLVDQMLGRVQALNRTVQDVLSFARVRPPEPTDTSLVKTLTRIRTLLESDPRFSDVEMVVPTALPRVKVDPEHLYRAVLNLVINAAQAMDGAGRVEVEATRADAQCRLVIRDTGPGIPGDQLEQVMEPFYSTRPRGTGLGLALVRRFAEQNGGRLELRSEPGEGATAIIWLPLA